MNLHIYMILIIWIILIRGVLAQTTPFNPTPDWTSNPAGHIATGLGVADINQDGWDDIVVANGNDIQRQSLVVYYNDGSGSFPLSPSWSSADIDYLGHLSIGDLNGDNLPDVAVSVFLGPAGFSEPGYVKVYYNTGTTLENIPSYQTADSMFTFSCALGDADGDGDLDLAVAGGQPYSIGLGPYQTNGRIYYNQNGVLDSLPGWQSLELMAALDVDFADMDNNGYLDVIFACHLTPNYIFLSDSGGNIANQASWNSGDMNYYANSLTISDIDSNNFADIVISDNNQLGGHGKFKSYLFNSIPSGQSVPNWLSFSAGFGSAVLLEDLNNDNHVDLLTGRWWGSVDFYPGNSGTFSSNPAWTSATNSVIEAYVLKDLDQDGRQPFSDTIAVQNDSIHVVYLSKNTVEEIFSVKLNDIPLTAGIDFSYNSELKWLSFSQILFSGDQIIVDYNFSLDRDLLVSNWDSDEGNYLFYNQTFATNVSKNFNQVENHQISVNPNPFNNICSIQIYSPLGSHIKINIYDIQGRLIKNLVQRKMFSGSNTFNWYADDNNGFSVSSGTYFYIIEIDQKIYNGKILLLK